MASFLDSLTGTFTGQPAIDAAQSAQRTLGQVFGEVVTNNRNNREESLGDVTSGALYGRETAGPFYDAAAGQLIGSGNRAIDTLGQIYVNPLNQTAGMAANALGLNGPGGTAAAQAAFQAGPGYQWATEQGLDAVARNANASGMLLSGNMLREAQTFGQGLANQEYNNWLKNITGREQLYAPLAGRQADVITEQGRNLANLYNQEAQFYNQSYNEEAARRAANRLGYAGLDVNAAGIFGPALASTDLAQGAAAQQAGANTVSAALGVGNLIGNIFRPGR